MEAVGSSDSKKFSLSFKGSRSNKSNFNRDLVQDKEVKEEDDFVTEISANAIKSSKKAEKKKEFVIPALLNDNVLRKKLKLKDGLEIEREIQQEIFDSATRRDEPVVEEDDGKKPVIAMDGGNNFDTALQAHAEAPTMNEYEEMPIEEFGTALLRGMGWKPGQSIGARGTKMAKPIEVKLRPKGMGLGAEQLLRTAKQQREHERRHQSKEQENLIVKSGAFVKIMEGAHKDKYGMVDGIDDEAGRVHISLAISKEKVSCNENFVIAVGKQEYNDFGKCLNRDRYDDYRSKHGGADIKKEPDTIDLSAGFEKKARDAAGKSKQAKPKEEKRPFIGYWLRSQLRVRIVDDKWMNGKYSNAKVVIEDVLARDVCLCRTDDGRLLDDVRMDMLETVLPRSSSQSEVPVMVVAGKYVGQIGFIVERDKKKSCAHVEFVQDRSVHKLDFDYICEYTGNVM